MAPDALTGGSGIHIGLAHLLCDLGAARELLEFGMILWMGESCRWDLV